MTKKTKSEQATSPFPSLKWDNHAWVGKTLLPSWKGFETRQGAYAARSSIKTSDGTIRLNVIPLEGKEKQPPTPEQAAAFQFLLDNEAAIQVSVLNAIFEAYPDWQDEYGFEDEEAEELMPAIEESDQLKRLIGLSTVHILPVAKNGIAYVGFELGCTWDDEHGLGTMTHQKRVVKVGGADTSFLEWIAANDTQKK